ncbi:MAG: amino acid ABC transporter permease [Chloroflexota bacterium]|nr:amino acid ABC transporter permease [Chloroflexota bacterium]MDE2960913.1 amino acid ABC transporter permease [Chloroflexota bacterium]
MSTVTEPVAIRLPPPRSETGVVGWLRANLFSSWFNTVLTVVVGAIAVWALWFALRWLLVDADFTVVSTLGGLLLIGQYNTDLSCPGQNCFWRPQAALLLVTILLGMSWAIAGSGLTKRIAIAVAVVIALFAFLPYSLERMGWDVRLLLLANVPALLLGWALARYTALGTWRWVSILAVVAFLLILVLLRGLPGVPGLQPVSVLHWGGLMLNLLLAVAGIVVSFPIGIALALGRRSRLPVVKLLCVVFIEVFRGVPLITLLFMSQVLVPLAFPENFPLNSLLRAAIIITLFSAAYMAENIRGGLQALHPGQAEAARALGLPGWQTTLLISLPQAIRNVIPAIVGQFIALFKDTSLVYIIGMLDIVELSRKFATTYVENGMLPYLDDVHEVFIFLAVVFWIFCFGMSYVSGRIERHLGVGER